MNKQQIEQALSDIASELKQLELWQTTAPSLSQFASEQPFFMDKMAPHEWLQWVLLPNLRYLLENDQLPPNELLITPYFEMVWQSETTCNYQPLLQSLMRLDALFAG